MALGVLLPVLEVLPALLARSLVLVYLWMKLLIRMICRLSISAPAADLGDSKFVTRKEILFRSQPAFPAPPGFP